METQESRAKLGAAGWAELIDRHRRGEGTVDKLCAAARVSVASFYYWKKRLRKQEHPRGTGDQNAATFIEVALPTRNEAVRIEVESPTGWRIHVQSASLEQVLRALREVGC